MGVEGFTGQLYWSCSCLQLWRRNPGKIGWAHKGRIPVSSCLLSVPRTASRVKKGLRKSPWDEFSELICCLGVRGTGWCLGQGKDAGHSCPQNLRFHNNPSLMAPGRHLEEFIQRTLGKILLGALLLQDVSQDSSFCKGAVQSREHAGCHLRHLSSWALPIRGVPTYGSPGRKEEVQDLLSTH